MQIGSNIQKFRKVKGISQEEMANSLNVTRQCVSLWETDQTIPTLENLQAISNLLNVPIGKLLDPNYIEESNLAQIKRDKEEELKIKVALQKEKEKKTFRVIGFSLALISILFVKVTALDFLIPLAGCIFSFLGRKKEELSLINIIGIVGSITFIVASILNM